MSTMGERLNHLREESGKDIMKVSRETGIGRSTIYKWESDFNKPRLAELIIIAEYYGVSLDYIVFGRKTCTPTTTKSNSALLQANL